MPGWGLRVAPTRAAVREPGFNLEPPAMRAPMVGRIARRYANPGAGASTLNVSTMFDLEPDAPRIARAESVESDIPNVRVGQQVDRSAGSQLADGGNIGRTVNALGERAKSLETRQADQQALAAAAQQTVSAQANRFNDSLNSGAAAYQRVFSL